MEVKGEEDGRIRSEDHEDKEDYYSLLNSPCSAFHKALEAILRCLGLESSSSSSSSEEEELEVPAGTETVEEIGFIAKIAGMLRRRRPRPPHSSGQPGQIN